ncbi:MAG: hypothetical protein WCL19_08920, partial [Verrucomicrobiota bacterium]
VAAGRLKVGDLIIAVNNARITGASEFFLRLAASAAVRDTDLYLIRDEQALRINLPALPPR